MQAPALGPSATGTGSLDAKLSANKPARCQRVALRHPARRPRLRRFGADPRPGERPLALGLPLRHLGQGALIAVSAQAEDVLHKYEGQHFVGDPRKERNRYVPTRELSNRTVGAAAELADGVGKDLSRFKELAAVEPDQTRNFRSDMYVLGETLR